MVKPIRAPDKVRLDIPKAIKRAFMHRGLIIGKTSQRKPVEPDNKPVRKAKKAEENIVQPVETEQGQLKVEAELKDPKVTPPEEGPEKLLDITEKAHEVLFEANTVFPFTLFPDTITLDREKLTVATRPFFRMAKIISVPVGAILSAEADVGPFFGSVQMTSKYFVKNSYSVNFLWRQDATTIQRLLQGYIIAHERDIDCNSIDKEQLVILLNDLGQGASD